jgi:ribosomal protein L22
MTTTLRDLQKKAQHSKNSRNEAAAIARQLQESRQIAREAATDLKGARRGAALQILQNSNANFSRIRTAMKPTTPYFTHERSSGKDRLSSEERNWVERGKELAEAIKMVTEAKEKMLATYRRGAPVNVNLDIDLERVEQLGLMD